MNVQIIIILHVLITTCLTEKAPIVRVHQGLLQGSTTKTRNGKPFLAFQGIPYAEPPVGELRFKEPSPGKPWEGVLDATKEHAHCLQINVVNGNYTPHGKEDCLYLNVFTPKISDELLPVIFYIHGGGFVIGDANPSSFGPDLLLEKDVIFIATNYRLGALGFLSTHDKILPGNYGLKDQSLALKWAKENIKQFGGNPEKITITGHSAGAASVYFHLLSPLSRDIPFAAIALSGIAPALWNIAQKGISKKNSKQLAKVFNCSTTTSQEMINCLRKIPAYDILEGTLEFTAFNDITIPFKPVIDSYSENPFLPKHPIEIIKSGQMAHIPFMTGITTEDGAIKSSAIYNNYSLVNAVNSKFNEFVANGLYYSEVGFYTEGISDSLREFYFMDKEINNETKSELTNLATDAMFMVPARMTATLHSKHSTKPVYFYLFGYKGATSYTKIFGDLEYDYGVCHCDDLFYLIPLSFAKHEPSLEDLKMTDIMTTIWYNFATTGDPTPELNSLLTTKWDPVVSDDLEYYYIKDSNTFKMDKNLYEERYQFWKKLPIHNENHTPKDEL